jgi:hypothetical protein
MSIVVVDASEICVEHLQTQLTRTSTHPTTTHLHECKMPKDLHSDEKRGPSRQYPRIMHARAGW